jgi:short-subunit dehydrogenase
MREHIGNERRNVIVMGATSGIGRTIAVKLAQSGWRVAIAGRREILLKQLCLEEPNIICYRCIDITSDEAEDDFNLLTESLGGLDMYVHCSGIGYHNNSVDTTLEKSTATTNCVGFVKMVTCAYHYFSNQLTGGHITVISSIAGTRGLGAAPAYSATKRFQNSYIDALAQNAYMRRTGVTFTDVRPGFIDTDLLKGRHYPLTMPLERASELIVKAIISRKRRVVIDWKYRFVVWAWRLIPQAVWERLHIG